MKIAIFPTHGGSYIPPFIKEKLVNSKGIRTRVAMADILEKLEVTHDKITQEIYDSFASKKRAKNNSFEYLKDSENPNIVYIRNTGGKYNTIHTVKIVEVDTTRVWKIAEYDCSEFIQYYKEPKIEDKELNYAEW